MNTPKFDDEQIVRELQSLSLAREEGTLDAEGHDRLERLVLEQPRAAEIYVASLLQTVSLRAWAEASQPGRAGVSQRNANDALASPTSKSAANDTPAGRSPLLGFLDRLPVAIHPVHHPVWFFVTTAVLTSLFWGVLVWNIWPRGGGEPAGVARRNGRLIPFIARLTHAEEVVWNEGAEPVRPGAYLAAGQRLEVKSGRLHVLFGDGARVAVEGPAALRIDSRKGLTLDAGRALARVEGKATARGFRVETPHAELIDLGTEFGAEVRPEETEVQVFEGKVEVLRIDDPRDRGRRLAAGEAAVFGNSPQQGFYVKEKKMNRAIYASLTAILSLPVPAAAATIAFQASRDTALNSTDAGFNNGAQLAMGLGTAGGSNDSRLLYHFNVSSLAGQYQTIDSITLRLFMSSNQISDASSNPGLDVFVHEITAANAAWIEGTKSFAAATAGEPTWNHRQASSVAWTGGAGLATAGTAYVATPLSSANVPSSSAVDAAVDFTFTGDLTALIDGWQSVNAGLLLRTTLAGGVDRAFFHSREVANEDFHPQLIITYTEVPLVPEPATGAVLGLGGLMLWGALRRRRSR